MIPYRYPILTVCAGRFALSCFAGYSRASRMRLNGVSLARRNRVKPALRKTSASRASPARSEEHTSELQPLMRISYAVFCLKQKKKKQTKLEQRVRAK